MSIFDILLKIIADSIPDLSPIQSEEKPLGFIGKERIHSESSVRNDGK
ncbi:MAG TPA: hypothetical protein PLX69_24430 [Leptospiraceae bacterium]|nr:hypothetical protein [Leptospiraceae bacterium]